MERRQFLQLGGAGLIGTSATAQLAATVAEAQTAATQINLSIVDTQVTLIDGEKVDALAFVRSGGGGGPRVPGPVLRVRQGDTVTIRVTNQRPEPHGFEIGGISRSRMTIGPSRTTSVTFTAPLAGTYLYHDASHASRHLYRLLGLHGAFIVHPRDGRTASGSRTPYSLERLGADPGAPKVASVFDALGTTARFPGGKWVPCGLDAEFSTQERIWLFNQIDPRLNALIRPSGVQTSSLAASNQAIVAAFTPRYFTINGRSGFDVSSPSEAPDVVISNYIGEPTLIRTLNAGLCHHATHIHGNHLFELAHSVLSSDGFLPFMGASRTGAPGEVVLHDNIWERDVWPTWPLQIRDMLLPLEVPPDIPNWDKFANSEAQEPFPLRYVMHDHCEMGTTAAGGNYPQGAVTHWEVLGRVNGRGQS